MTSIYRHLYHPRFTEPIKLEYFTVLKKFDERPTIRDYFNESWRRDDWASLEEFAIPLPDFGTWVRPEYIIVENRV